jgi:O-antigen/teichoic acid export membrane protein
LDWDLLRTLWPNCWRLGVVATGAFLILQANTLICSAYLGLAETAAYGLSLQLVSMMVGVSSIWITTQQPLVAQMRAQHDLDGIARLYGRRMRWFVLSVLFGGGLICCLAPYFLRIIGARTPLLPWPVLLLLIVILALEAHHGHYAMLVMSENRNPFVLPAIISGLAVVLISSWLTPRFGVLGMLLAQGLVQASFNNWWPIRRAMQGLGESRFRYWSYFSRPSQT